MKFINNYEIVYICDGGAIIAVVMWDQSSQCIILYIR